MQQTTFDTITVRPVGSTTPSVIANNSGAPARVLLRNVGPVVLLISHDVENLAQPGGPSTGVFRLPPAQSDVIVLAPRQNAYCVGAGAGGLLSISVSEAYPIMRG